MMNDGVVEGLLILTTRPEEEKKCDACDSIASCRQEHRLTLGELGNLTKLRKRIMMLVIISS